MKHYLFFILAISLLACQPQVNNDLTEETQPQAADTAALAPASTEAPDSAFLIVPGESIGEINLLMPANELYSIMGKADSGDAAMGKSLQFWISNDPKGKRSYVAAYTVNNFDGSGSPPKVQQIQVTASGYKTKSGIGTGDTFARVRKEFSNLRPLAYYTNQMKQQVYIYDDQPQGIAFEITIPDSTCTAITVHPKGENVTETYLPIHPDMTRLKGDTLQ
ncbi:hypothetical protein ACSX1A_14895 [Pontibacter sp. MBLB2868]|uniref:hypothetical protein n=1 Tax=Pontibacter sp. MBLB2868 TaxID=3451555 RepID=UPI003F74B8AA